MRMMMGMIMKMSMMVKMIMNMSMMMRIMVMMMARTIWRVYLFQLFLLSYVAVGVSFVRWCCHKLDPTESHPA